MFNIISSFFNRGSDDSVPASVSGNARILGCEVSEGGNEVLIRVEILVPQEQSMRHDLPAYDSAEEEMARLEPPMPSNMPDAAADAVDGTVSGAGKITEESRDEIAEAARDIKRASRQVQSAAERVVNFEDNLIRESNAEAVRRMSIVYGNLYDGWLHLRDMNDDGSDESVEQAESAMRVALDQLRRLLEQVYEAEMIESEEGSQYASYSQDVDADWGDVRDGCPVESVRPGVRYLGKVELKEKVKPIEYREY